MANKDEYKTVAVGIAGLNAYNYVRNDVQGVHNH